MSPRQYAQYQALELLPAVPAAAAASPLQRLARALKKFDCPGPQASQPKIWKTTDAAGQVRWNIFDPLTGRTALTLSEVQFQAWLARRYNP